MNTGTTLNYTSVGNQGIQSIVSGKGQVTVPSHIRNTLGLKKGDKVAFIVDKNKKVELVKKGSVVTQTAGIFKTDKVTHTAEQLREEAERAIAQEAMQRAV